VTGPRLETLEGWGMSCRASSWVYRPRAAEQVAEAVRDARYRGLTIAHRGAGRSYGDAALNEGGAVLDLSGLDRILDFDAERGVVRAEAGVTVGRLWRHVLAAGWWPPVVPGTMEVTLGGAAAMNIHGKNAFRAGPFGEHVEALTLLDADGDVFPFGREAPRLRDAIGAQGLNGTILDVTVRLKRVASGYLEVVPAPVGSLREALEELDRAARESDYAVGWLDAFATGRALGRGVLHRANHLPPDHSLAGRGLDPSEQRLPSRILGAMPKRHVWRALKPFNNGPGMRAVNLAKYLASLAQGRRPYVQTHAAFHFLLDYVPDWKLVYRPRGLVQYQFFVPEEHAERVLGEALRLQHRAGVASHLAVLKRHRADDFAASYAVDGFSLALDFPVRAATGGGPAGPAGATALDALLRSFDALQREAGGRIYAAKDSSSVGRLPRVREPAYGTNLARRWEAGA